MEEKDDNDESGMEVLRLLLEGGKMKMRTKNDEETERAIMLQRQVVSRKFAYVFTN